MQEAEVVPAVPSVAPAPNADMYSPEALKAVAEQSRAEQADEAKERFGNRRYRRNFKRLWRAVREGCGYSLNNTVHKYTRHKATRQEIKARRKNGRR
ncbi:MAG: hypothetical protein NC218_03740 [Acetobacter sp.]|nr:hypothetical protein [Acetobacter sp.]